MKIFVFCSYNDHNFTYIYLKSRKMKGVKCAEFLTFNDTLYIVHRRIPKGTIKENHVLDVRDMWHCDTVLKTKNQEQEVYLFLIECPDAEIIEETPYSENSDQS